MRRSYARREPESAAIRLVFRVRYGVSRDKEQIPGVGGQVSGVGCQMSGLRPRVNFYRCHCFQLSLFGAVSDLLLYKRCLYGMCAKS